jgi:hypothetical protein
VRRVRSVAAETVNRQKKITTWTISSAGELPTLEAA